jgi:hypothetical protein
MRGKRHTRRDRHGTRQTQPVSGDNDPSTD